MTDYNTFFNRLSVLRVRKTYKDFIKNIINHCRNSIVLANKKNKDYI